VFALPAPPADADPYEPTLEEIAEYHLAQVRAVQPSGPYSLIGWSMGGALAVEIAGRLRHSGEQIDLLALIDCYQAEDFSTAQETEMMLAFVAHLGSVLDRPFTVAATELDALSFTDALARVLAVAREGGVLTSGTDLTDPLNWLTLLRAHNNAQRHYQPTRPVEHLLLVFASEGDAVVQERAAGWWQKVSEQTVHRYTVTGNHYSILVEPQVRELAAVLARAIHATAALTGDLTAS
jgi:thioesterase domain-containing protein